MPIHEAMEAFRSKALGHATEPSSLVDQDAVGQLSESYKYESSMWEARQIEAEVRLDVDAFGEAVATWSKSLCGLGVTATLFDENSEKVFQETISTMYTPFVEGGYSQGSGYGPMEEGWTGDTTYTPYSNTKGVASATYLASVVDQGLGYLDEPISATFSDLKGSKVGKMTPRQIMSHTSGLKNFNREDPENDPYYSCKYDKSKTLLECVETFFFTNDSMDNPPGTLMAYNNEPFDILAVLAVEKTGMNDWGEIFQKFIADPLGMTSTSYDCPVLKSTDEKPGVAWGLCSTGHDFPKFVQMLSLQGKCPSGQRVLTKDSVRQMFLNGAPNARNNGDLIWNAMTPLYMTRCYPRMVKGALGGLLPDTVDVAFPYDSLAGYGLGTMFFLGNEGEIFGHAGTTGGAWLVAPGRFAAYITWMASRSSAPVIAGATYTLLGQILNSFETASDVAVKSSVGTEDGYEDIETCGGYIDLFEEIGISSMAQLTELPTCPGDEHVHAIEEVHPLSKALKRGGYSFGVL